MLVNCLQGWLVARSRPGSGSGKLLPSHSIRTFEVRATVALLQIRKLRLNEVMLPQVGGPPQLS